MMKNAVRWWVILVVILVVYNVTVFAIPFHKNGVFYLSWLFTIVAIFAQIYVIRTAFYSSKEVKSKFYGLPVAKVGAIYLSVQLVLGIAFMALNFVVIVPIWVPLVLYVMGLGVSAAGFIAADSIRDEVVRQDTQLEKNVSCMRALQSKVASMPYLIQDNRLCTALEGFAEKLRFSDPVSSEALTDIEAALTICIDELQQAVVNNNIEAVFMLLQKAESVLIERNRLCKLNKLSTC